MTFFGKRRQKVASVPIAMVAFVVDREKRGGRSTMPTERLTKSMIDALEPRASRYMVGDGHRLYIVVRPSGVKTWLSRVRWQGRDVDISLGTWPEVDIQEARKKHLENRGMARDGLDPRRPAAMLFRDLWADWPDHCPL